MLLNLTLCCFNHFAFITVTCYIRWMIYNTSVNPHFKKVHPLDDEMVLVLLLVDHPGEPAQSLWNWLCWRGGRNLRQIYQTDTYVVARRRRCRCSSFALLVLCVSRAGCQPEEERRRPPSCPAQPGRVSSSLWGGWWGTCALARTNTALAWGRLSTWQLSSSTWQVEYGMKLGSCSSPITLGFKQLKV